MNTIGYRINTISRGSKGRLIYHFKLLLLITIYILSFYFIEWTEDRYNYEQMISNISDYNTDFLFTRIAVFAVRHNYTYDDVRHWHIIVQAVFFGLFSVKVFKKPLFPCIIAIMLNFVNIANQLRFFAGFWAFLYGMTFYDKRRLLYYLLGLFACLNHITLCVLFLCLPLRKLWLSISCRRYIIIALVVIALTPLLTLVLPGFLQSFSKYIDQGQQSSFLGGVFNLFPSFFFVALFYIKRSKVIKSKQPREGLIEVLCVFSFLFIPLSIVYQLFSQRFVFTFISLWIAYLIDNKETKINKNLVRVLCLFSVFWYYLAPALILGYSYYLDNLLVMLGIKPFMST